MKFSNNYIIYPDNKALEDAIAHYLSLQPAQAAEAAAPDSRIAVQDNFTHTRGNYEQHRYSSNVLEHARETLEAVLAGQSREETPGEWAKTHNNLGNIFAAQGQQLRDADAYNRAIAAFDSALEVFDQDNTPNDWAATQYNLATAKQALGRQLNDSKLLKASTDAYTNALLVWSREQNPQEWSATMHRLGAAFHAYGKMLKGNRTFQKSVVAYKNALAELDADNHALDLAATHNNRGAVLHNLAESEENTERLEEAIRSYDTALTICMEQQLPIHLAVLCRVNISTARAVLAEMTRDPATAEEAADDFELIIECFNNACQPLCLKHCEEQLSKAQSMAETFSA